MTQLEKIEELKNTIQFLYEKEGKSINYISKLLELDRKILSYQIKQYNFVKPTSHNLNPSTQKFLNKIRPVVIKKLKEQLTISEISNELNISRDHLYYLFSVDEELKQAKLTYDSNKRNIKKETEQQLKYFENLPEEEWKEILGYPNYFVSNMGRFKKYLPSYDCYTLINPTSNSRTGRLYISLSNENKERKNLIVSRIVGFAFCSGHSEINNTIDHIDGNILNNKATNLQWVSQGENNKRDYTTHPNKKHKGYSKNGKFKEIIINNKYSFKTIKAASKFLNISESQFQRYIDKECKFDGTIELKY